MSESEIQQPILVITGMHRSGTSLVASLLQSAGLDIGKTLLEADHGNPKGYYENTDFIKFHESVLYSLGINTAGWTLERDICPPQYYIDRALSLIHENESTVNSWGWKDPRTSLFLPFWSSLLPEAKFIFIYRSPWEVIDSLYRRTDDIFSHHPEFALKVWSNYNQAILDFYLSFTDRCLLVNLNNVTNNNVSIAELIQNKFNINLPPPNSEIYDRSLLVKNPYDSHRPAIIKHYFADAFNLYCKLNEITGFQDELVRQYTQGEISPSWLLQDWLSLRQSDKLVAWKIEYIQSELQENRGQLELTRSELQENRGQLELTRSELLESRGQLEQTRSELLESRGQLELTRSELLESRGQLEQTRSELLESREQLERTRCELQESRGQLERTRSELQESRGQLELTRGELQGNRSQLEWTRGELHRSRDQLERITTELQESNARLERAENELHRSHIQTEQLQAELLRLDTAREQSRNRIEAMESSKFWKLRKGWFQLKRKFGLGDNE